MAFLDYDDIWYPNHLSTAIDTLANNDGAAASYSAFDVVRGATKEPVRTARQQGPVTRHTVLSGGNRPSITTMVIRRHAMAAAGGFNPVFDGADDLDLVYRLVDQGPIFGPTWSQWPIESMMTTGQETAVPWLRASDECSPPIWTASPRPVMPRLRPT